MQNSSNIRAISLVLALSVIVAGWLLFEYGNQQLGKPQPPQIAAPNENRQKAGLPNSLQLQPKAISNNIDLTFKCEKNARISYSDQPCADNERAISVMATEKAAPARNNLEQLRERVAAMEVSRLERDKQFAAATTAQITPPTGNANQIKEMRCQQIDLVIVAKDSELRQPHSAQWGDYLTGERKKLMDERFSIGC